jgi:hypothetical protein
VFVSTNWVKVRILQRVEEGKLEWCVENKDKNWVGIASTLDGAFKAYTECVEKWSEKESKDLTDFMEGLK